MPKEKKQTKEMESKVSENYTNYLKEKKIKVRGRTFKGKVIRKFPSRITIEFERTLFIKKYERYAKKKTKLHARMPEFMGDEINLGDLVEIRECRPLSKITHFIVVRKITGERK